MTLTRCEIWQLTVSRRYWNNEFELFYNPKTGVDIDGAWIDMNDPASVSSLYSNLLILRFLTNTLQFCEYPCTDPFQQAIDQQLPPNRTSPPPDKSIPPFTTNQTHTKRTDQFAAIDHSRDNLFVPPYAIENHAGGGNLSDRTAWVDSLHSNGFIEYDTRTFYLSI